MKRNPEEQRTYERNKKAMYRRDGWKCRYCNRRDSLTPHHVVFQGHGGVDDLNNLLTLCVRCHDDVHARRLLLTVVTLTPTDLVVTFWRK